MWRLLALLAVCAAAIAADQYLKRKEQLSEATEESDDDN